MQQDYVPPAGIAAPLRQILARWRQQIWWLVGGAVLAILSAATAVGLMTGAGLLIGGIAVPLWALALLGPARVVLRYIERLVTHNATFRALTDLRLWFFRGLAARSGGGLGFRRAGDLLSRLASDVEALDGLYLRLLVPLVTAIALTPILIWFLVIQHTATSGWATYGWATFGSATRGWAAFGWAAVGLFLLAAFGVPFLTLLVSHRSNKKLSEARAALTVAATDLAFGLREIRAFGAEATARTTVRNSEKHLLAAQSQLAHRGTILNAIWLLCSQAAILAVLAGAPLHPAYATAAIFMLIVMFETIGALPRAGLLAGHQAHAARRVLEAAGGPPPSATTALARSTPALQNTDLSFEDVSFRWAADRPAVFNGLWMKIPAGSRIAVLGPSGIGKSTLAALALKVVQPQTGRVTLGGVDVADLSDKDVRGAIAWIGQQTHLFEDTIRANVALGDPSATEDQIWWALDQAAIGDFVRALPDGLGHFVGESGSGFSGGQGRRLALARALLSTAPILILDEPCAGLDAATAYEFIATLNALPAGRTMILITHHLTGMEQLDYVWGLSAGQASLG